METFSEFPALVVWEMTRACRLACVHCRAVSSTWPHPCQLTREEGLRFLDQVVEAQPKLLILTGGDPARREDLLEMIEYATGRGLRVALSPGATPDFLSLDFPALKAAGVCRVSLSLDGGTPEEHNRFRGVSRAWQWTMEGAEKLRRAGLGLQINSTITSTNIDRFDALAETVEQLEPAGWTIFLVVPTGRAGEFLLPGAEAVEALFQKLLEMSRRVKFEIRTTEGQHFRRVMVQSGASPSAVPAPVNDGKGFVFVSHTGDICPSGFLPVVCGSVRNGNLLQTYRNAPLFQKLRDSSALKGKCGRCEFNRLCGGSRARVFGLTGDAFGEDPLCIYQPGKS